jgi:hypothetical protein
MGASTMSDWLENENGNYVFVEDGEVTTVFRDRLGDWRGLRSGERTRGSFDSPEELMEGIELEIIEFIPIVANSGWKSAKKGGYYRKQDETFLSVKRSKSGSWYITVNGELIKNCWMPTAKEAQRIANSYVRDCLASLEHLDW